MFQFRFWPNNNSRMYVLEGVTPCIQSMQLLAGDIGTFQCLSSRRFHFHNDVICLFIPFMFVCICGYKLSSPFNLVVHFIQIIVRLHITEQRLILLPKLFTCHLPSIVPSSVFKFCPSFHRFYSSFLVALHVTISFYMNENSSSLPNLSCL